MGRPGANELFPEATEFARITYKHNRERDLDSSKKHDNLAKKPKKIIHIAYLDRNSSINHYNNCIYNFYSRLRTAPALSPAYPDLFTNCSTASGDGSLRERSIGC
jgi:hypothetical protein